MFWTMEGCLTVDWTLHATHTVPAGQPESVHQLARRLFPAYTVDGGRMHLAGCTLEDRLFARLRYQADETGASAYVDADGQELDYGEAEALGLVDTAPIAQPLPQWGLQLNRFLTVVAPGLRRREIGAAMGDLTALTLIWCRFAEGKLRFTIGDAFVDLPFAGWARTLEAPPFVCRYTGASTFHLAQTDDGRIAPFEQIGCCEQTGRKTLLAELVTCSATGRRVLPEEAPPCPVCGEPVCLAARIACDMCGELVSPAVIEGGRCRACRALRPLDKDDPRVARLLHEYPGLDGWRRWEAGETATVAIMTATGWLRRLLVVLDKETLALKRMATQNRLQNEWTPVNPEQHDYVLRE